MKTRIDEVRSSRRKGGNENEFLVSRGVERKRKKERGQINIRDVAQQRFARRSLCFEYFCILRDTKVRLRNFRDSLHAINAAASRYVSDPFASAFSRIKKRYVMLFLICNIYDSLCCV